MDLPIVPLIFQHVMHLPMARKPGHSCKAVPDDAYEEMRPVVAYHFVMFKVLVCVVTQFNNRPGQGGCQ